MPPRRKNELFAERVLIPFAHAGALSADTSAGKVWKTPAGRALRIERVTYINPTGFAEDASNYMAVVIRHGAGPTIAASYSTQPVANGGNGTISANTTVELPLSATDANRVVPAGTEIEVFIDETGTVASFPAGNGIIEGILL